MDHEDQNGDLILDEHGNVSRPERHSDWDGTSGNVRTIERIVTDAVVQAQKQKHGIGVQGWAAIVGLIFAMAGGIYTLSFQMFRSKADGQVADAKFDAHVATFKAHADAQATRDDKLDVRLERIDNKLDWLVEHRKGNK